MAKTTPLQDPILLAAALEGLELQKARLEEQILSVKAMIGGKAPRQAAPAASVTSDAAPAKKATRKRRRNKLSAEARARIAEAQKKRWAAFRKTTKK